MLPCVAPAAGLWLLHAVIASASYGGDICQQEFMQAVSFFSEELAFLMLSL